MQEKPMIRSSSRSMYRHYGSLKKRKALTLIRVLGFLIVLHVPLMTSSSSKQCGGARLAAHIQHIMVVCEAIESCSRAFRVC